MKSSFTTTSLGIFTLAVLALGAGSAAAGWRTAQDRQHQRIHAGRENGELTRGEFRRHTGAAGDPRAGTPFRRLDRALDRASYNIRSARHDHDRLAGGAPYSPDPLGSLSAYPRPRSMQ